MASAPQRTISQRAVMVESPVLWSGPGNRALVGRRCAHRGWSPKATAESGADIAKNGWATQRSKMPGFVGFSGCRRPGERGAPAASAPAATSPVERRTHLRQRVNSRRRLLSQVHLFHVPLHLEAGEPFDVAREIDIGPHAAHLVHGSIGRQVLHDLVAGFLLGIEAPLDVLVGCAPAQQADHHAGGRLAGRLDVDDWDLPASLAFERSEALARLWGVRTGREILKIQVERSGGAAAQRVGPGFLVGVLARLIVERGDALARLRGVRA